MKIITLTAIIFATTSVITSSNASNFDNGMAEPDNLQEQIPDKYLEMYHTRADKFRTVKRSYSVKGSENPRQFEFAVERSTR